VQKGIGEGVVELQRDAYEEGSQREYGEVAVLEKIEDVRGEDIADFEAMSRSERRCVRQGQSIKAKEDRTRSSHANWGRCGFSVGDKKAADGGDSKGGEDPDRTGQ